MRRRLLSSMRTFWLGTLSLMLASCIIQFRPMEPKEPSPLQLATSLQVEFDYSGLMVSGMGGAKSEAEWVQVKSAEDPEYPKTWAELKSKWEASFFEGLASGSPLPVSRAPVAPAAASARAPGSSDVLLAQADAAAQPVQAATSEAQPTATDANLAAPAASPAAPAPAEPAPATPTAAPFDGVLTVRVALNSLHMGKYIPMFTQKAQVQVLNTWWASGRMVADSNDKAEYAPTITTPSVFQHIQVLGNDAGRRAAGFLRKQHKR